MDELIVTGESFVQGMRAVGWCMRDARLEHDVSALESMFEEFCNQALDAGFNAVVNVQICINPFCEDGVRIEISGTPALMRPMFGEL